MKKNLLCFCVYFKFTSSELWYEHWDISAMMIDYKYKVLLVSGQNKMCCDLGNMSLIKAETLAYIS